MVAKHKHKIKYESTEKEKKKKKRWKGEVVEKRENELIG